MDAIQDFAGVLDLLPLLDADALVLFIKNVDVSRSRDVLILFLGTEKDG